FLFTRIRSPKAQRLGLRVALRNSDARLWVSGVEQPFEDAVGNLPLEPGVNRVLLELPDGGRGMLHVQAQPPSVATLEEAAHPRVVPKLEEATWIRDPNMGTGYVRKTFHLEQVPTDARLVVTAYTGYRLMINGVNVVEDIGPWARWTHPESVNISPFLQQGENVIAAWIQVLHGQNVHAIPEHKGLALALAAQDPDGRVWQLTSDASWKGSAEERANWDRPGLDDRGWQRVEVLGPMGSDPWGRELLAHVGTASEPHRPLAIDLPSPYLTCFDAVPDIAYDILPETAIRVGWYRFVAPPGLAQLKLPTRGQARVWVDGREIPVGRGQLGREKGAIAGPLVATVGDPPAGRSRVTIRLQMARGEYGGAAFSTPIGVALHGGTIEPGLWAEHGLPTYSGIGVYRQQVELTAEEAGRKTLLDLGQVLVAAQVWVDGESAGVRLARPFHYDLSELIHPGRNTIEVHVANTIAPHYTETNQVMNLGPTDSGLLGPVVLRQTGE
ncbi:MAG: glycosylhydrolase-like jelly roll fold domain-containing protein, partial [Pirellulales bacterium]